jgi:hypothetical protein
MMKQFIRILIGIFSISYACITFSATSTIDDEDCPPIFTIANVKFTSAAKFGTSWKLIHNLGYWNVNFIVDLNEAKTSEEALILGQKYYNTKVTLSSPSETPGALCIYTVTDSYTVFTSHFNKLY